VEEDPPEEDPPFRPPGSPHFQNAADKEHIAVGSDKIYVEADKDGFITCGLLWTPGSTIYYFYCLICL
jgi:hypothetical protein